LRTPSPQSVNMVRLKIKYRVVVARQVAKESNIPHLDGTCCSPCIAYPRAFLAPIRIEQSSACLSIAQSFAYICRRMIFADWCPNGTILRGDRLLIRAVVGQPWQLPPIPASHGGSAAEHRGKTAQHLACLARCRGKIPASSVTRTLRTSTPQNSTF